jgi:hypothetical protein
MMVEPLSSFSEISKDEIVILGICRDLGSSLSSTLKGLEDAFRSFQRVHIRVVESDSSDETVRVLNEYRRENRNFDFESLGQLETQISDRWERIAFCRNRVAGILKTDRRLTECKWVVVADLDGVNEALIAEAIESCWSRSDWDVCAANQSAPYYDVFALRHPTWSPNDCWRYEEELISLGMHPAIAREEAIYKRQKQIPQKEEWIPVNSAFGGLALYKRSYFVLGRYIGHTSDGFRTCEHVPFHEKLKEAGARIFINPALINCGWNEHNFQHLPINRFKRKLKRILIRLGLSKILRIS